MELDGYIFHLKARNLSPATIKATKEYLRPFVASHDPLVVSRRDLEGYLSALHERCLPSTVWTAWRHLKGFFTWLHAEGDLDSNPMLGVPRPLVPPIEVNCLNEYGIEVLLATCSGRSFEDRRDRAIITMMLDTGLRLSEVTHLNVEDIGDNFSLRIFGKGRKWRTVLLGKTSQQALQRWLRTRGSTDGALWIGRKGPLSTTGVQKMIRRRGKSAGLELHPHMLRHTFVDLWIRNGGSEVDLARLAGWTSTRMAERYARHRAEQRALQAHERIAPLDSMLLSANKSNY
jgi:site-specific recombinase XerD